jgi:MFS transporter, ACS family, solute carrier family 17 (sodium-dependent inorganic phosphate cotransporter), other
MTVQRVTRWPAHYTVVLLTCAAIFISYIDRTNISVGAIAMQAQLGWTETQKGLVLAAFFAGYLLTTVVGGALATRFGGKAVLGVAVVFWSIFTVLTPPAALLGLPALIVARIALGVGEGPVFPASINMIGRWVPASGRSRAVSLLTSTLALGTVFSLIVTGWLIQHYGWELPFYAFGLVGLVWAALWYSLVSSGSAIESDAQVTPQIPWKRLLLLPPVWAVLVGHFCGNWVLYVLLAWLPSYFKSTFGVTLANAGLLAAAPWLTSFLFSNIAGHIADRMLRAGRNASFVRKLMQSIGLMGPAVALLVLPHAGSAVEGVLIMCCATATWAFCGAGFAPNCFDIAPRFAAVIWGLSNTVATLPGIAGVYVTGWLVDRTGTFSAPFFLTSGVCVFGAVAYLLLASGNRHID